MTNGNYVVGSPYVAYGGEGGAGSATWGDGAVGTSGLVWVGNSVIGTHANDFVGDAVVALSNGNYVVASGGWDSDSAIGVGAVRWGDGGGGTVGAISASNSLVGTTAYDHVGTHVLALSNGHYVVCSPYWDAFGFVQDGGAVTWNNGDTGAARLVGAVTTSNSLYGAANYLLGSADCGVTLPNGAFVVASPQAFGTQGAALWGNGAAAALVTTSNSFVGSSAGDLLAEQRVAVGHGNYLLVSPHVGAGSTYGAVTWARGNQALVGSFNAARSLVGTRQDDALGSGGIMTYADGAYVVVSPDFQAGSLHVGALTVGNSAFRLKGQVSPLNSMIGVVAGGNFSYGYDPTHEQLVVGRRSENLVTLFKTDAIFPDSFDE